MIILKCNGTFAYIINDYNNIKFEFFPKLLFENDLL